MNRRSLAYGPSGKSGYEQAGLTLIELMIALLVSSILVGMVFAIYARMSVAYRSQSGVSELQQTVGAIKEHIVRHVRAAGHVVPQGFHTSAAVRATLGVATNPVPSIQVFNDDDGASADSFAPDKIRIYYGDASAMAQVTAATDPTITVDDASTFKDGDLAIMVSVKAFEDSSFFALDAGAAKVVKYDNCVVRINSVVGTTLNIGADGYYNPPESPDLNVCPFPTVGAIGNGVMIYRFVGRSFRIDPDPTPARRRLAVLQMSPSGETALAPDWQDLAAGVTDLQIAERWRLTAPGADLDGDGDASYDWYGVPQIFPGPGKLVEVSISLAVRTTADLNAVPTPSTPAFTGPDPNNNRLGDSPSFDLAGTLEAARPEHLKGNHIYRWTSVRVDLRNLGVRQ